MITAIVIALLSQTGVCKAGVPCKPSTLDVKSNTGSAGFCSAIIRGRVCYADEVGLPRSSASGGDLFIAVTDGGSTVRAEGSVKSDNSIFNIVKSGKTTTSFGAGNVALSVHQDGVLYSDGLCLLDGGQCFTQNPDTWTYVVLGSDQTTSNATATDVTGLSWAVTVSKNYEFWCQVYRQTAVANVDARLGFTWPSTMTDGTDWIETSNGSVGSNLLIENVADSPSLTTAVGMQAANRSYMGKIWGLATASGTASGNFQVRFASESAGTNVKVMANSFCRYRTW